MRTGSTIRKRAAEEGVALLISIFILLLISVVAIALIVSSGTESALAGNYRASTGVYYEAMAGLEEARSRLGKGPFAFKTTNSSNFLPTAGTPLAVGTTFYLINPVSGETVAPWDSSNVYYDTQFGKEFGPTFANPTSNSNKALSLWNRTDLTPNPNAGNYPGPLYKWVRINAVSEKSMNVVADSDTSPSDGISPLYYTGSGFTKNSSGGPQVIELTSYAILSNGTQKILQYVVAQTPMNLPPFLAALTLSDSSSNSATYHAPANNGAFVVQGNDYDCSGNATTSLYHAIGVFVSADVNPVKNGIPSIPYTPVPNPPTTVPNNYTGSGPAADVVNLSTSSPSFPSSWQRPSQLDAIAQTIIQNADAVVPPLGSTNPTQTGYLTSLGMSATNPMTVVANGDLDISNWSHDGYGLLLVTGTFTYDPDTIWNGIILVIGQGKIAGSHQQYKQINGAVLVAKTRDSSGNLLTDPNLGGATVQFDDNMQGNGIRYSSCWIQKSQPSGSYKVLSFHEIAQP